MIIFFISFLIYADDCSNKIRDAICMTACKGKHGGDYDGGYAKGNKCICTKEEELSEMLDLPIIPPLPPKPLPVYRYGY